MKRRHDAERWGDRHRLGKYAPTNARKGAKPLDVWRAEREAGFTEASKVLRVQHIMASDTVADKCPEPSTITSRNGLVLAICIRMPKNTASVWSPERGYENVEINQRPDVRRSLPMFWPGGTIFDELVRITRRAFVPGVVAQIYIDPMSALIDAPQAPP